MQPNSNTVNPLADASHFRSYDPSAPYREMMKPPPHTANGASNVPMTNIDPKTGAPKRIPQYYYPPYEDYDYDYDRPPPMEPPFVDPRETNPNILPQPPPPPQPVPNATYPYAQPNPWSGGPYGGAGPYNPYPTPYIIPITTNVPAQEPAPTLQERTKSELLATHQKDADLSRLEVYHFTPKQNTTLGMGGGMQPVLNYHVYPYPPGQPPVPMQQPPQQYPPYPYAQNGYPPNSYPYGPDPYQPVYPYTETRARGIQTEKPTTKNRGLSPIHFPSEQPAYDNDGYPYVDQRVSHTDRHNIKTGRIHPRVYDDNRTTPLADCRCLDCQRERSKVLNYYPE